MTVKQWIDQMQNEGMANFFVIYANIGNNSDELIVCEVCEASDCIVIDTQLVKNDCGVTAIITAEGQE